MVAENQCEFGIGMCGQVVLNKIQLAYIEAGMVTEVIPGKDAERSAVIARGANPNKEIITVVKVSCPGVLGRIVFTSLNRIGFIK